MSETNTEPKKSSAFWIGFIAMIVVGGFAFSAVFNTTRKVSNELIDIAERFQDRPKYPVFNLTAKFDKEDEAMVYIIENTGADSEYFALQLLLGGVRRESKIENGLKAGEVYFFPLYMGYQYKSGIELRVGVYAKWIQDEEEKEMEWELFYVLTEDDIV